MSYWNYNGLNTLINHRGVRKNVKKMEKEKEDLVKKRKEYLEDIILSKRGSLDDPRYTYILEEYINLRLDNVIKTELSGYPYHKIIITKENISRNYLACNIEIFTYYSKEDYERGAWSGNIIVSLKELFGNCSSIIIDKLRNSPSQLFTNTYMNILEDICNLHAYSIILYTCSDKETEFYTREYLSNNKDWEIIKQFKNKRNSHTITYYTKDL